MTCFQLPGSGGYENWHHEYSKPVGGRHQHILDDPVIFNYRGPRMTININGDSGSSSSGNFWTGLLQGLTGYNRNGVKTGWGIFDVGLAFLANRLMGGNRGGSAYPMNNFWGMNTPGFDTFDRAHTWVQPGITQVTPQKTKETKETEKKEETKKTEETKETKGTKETEKKEEPKIVPEKVDNTDDSTVDKGDGVPSAKYFNTFVNGDKAGIITGPGETDVSNNNGVDNVKAGSANKTNHSVIDNKETATNGYLKSFTISDKSGNIYTLINPELKDGVLTYQVDQAHSDLTADDNGENKNYEFNANYVKGTKLTVEIKNGKLVLTNPSDQAIAKK